MYSVNSFGASTKLMLATDSSASVKQKTLTVLQSWTSLFEGWLTELLIIPAVINVVVYPFYGLFSRIQKCKTILEFNEARDDGVRNIGNIDGNIILKNIR